jgi:hypothetical protein
VQTLPSRSELTGSSSRRIRVNTYSHLYLKSKRKWRRSRRRKKRLASQIINSRNLVKLNLRSHPVCSRKYHL